MGRASIVVATRSTEDEEQDHSDDGPSDQR